MENAQDEQDLESKNEIMDTEDLIDNLIQSQQIDAQKRLKSLVVPSHAIVTKICWLTIEKDCSPPTIPKVLM